MRNKSNVLPLNQDSNYHLIKCTSARVYIGAFYVLENIINKEGQIYHFNWVYIKSTTKYKIKENNKGFLKQQTSQKDKRWMKKYLHDAGKTLLKERHCTTIDLNNKES